MTMEFNDAGTIDFGGAVFPEIPLRSMSYRISDHLPLWAEFKVDRSVSQMAAALGLDAGHPDPLSTIPD